MKNNQTKYKETEIGLIPENWDVLKVEDFAEVVGGGTPPTKDPENFSGDIPWLTPRDLSTYQGRFISKGERNISERGLKNSGAKLLPAKSVLLTSRAPVGYLAIAADKITTNQGFQSLLPKKQFDSLFLFYLLKNDVDRLQSFASGSTFQELSGGVLRRMIFALPPLLEQQKIAEILGALDDKIELNRKMNKTLEQIAKTIYQKMFLNVNQGSLVGLGEKITIRKGKNITKDTVQAGNVPVVAGGLNPSCYHDTANTTAPVVTVSASGANAGFIRLYQDDVWASDCSYIDKTVTPYVYFYYLFLLENTENVSGLQRGSAQPHVYPKDLMELKMFNFDEKLIQKFEEIVIPIFEFISNNTKQVETLSQIRDFLLPRVMSGKLRVR